MEIATVKGETRKIGNRHAMKNLRAGGMLPAVIYGHKEKPEHVALSRRDLLFALEQGSYVISLEVGGQTSQYLLKEIQYDHLQQHPQHVDLMRVTQDETVTIQAVLDFRGTPAGAQLGGTFRIAMKTLPVDCQVKAIPDAIRVDISHLGINESIYAGDVRLPDGTSYKGDPRAVVATLAGKRGMTAAELDAEEGAADGPDEPEVIGRTAKDDGDDES